MKGSRTWYATNILYSLTRRIVTSNSRQGILLHNHTCLTVAASQPMVRHY